MYAGFYKATVLYTVYTCLLRVHILYGIVQPVFISRVHTHSLWWEMTKVWRNQHPRICELMCFFILKKVLCVSRTFSIVQFHRSSHFCNYSNLKLTRNFLKKYTFLYFKGTCICVCVCLVLKQKAGLALD